MNCAKWDECNEDRAPSIVEVRDMIVESLTTSHGPRFGETRSLLGLEDDEAAVRQSVQGMVRLAYTIAGGSYDAPTPDDTVKVANLLSERSVAWGAPADDVFAHHSDITRAIGRIRLAQDDDPEQDPGF